MDQRNGEEDYIAGRLTPSDWCKRKALLEKAGTSDLWAQTFEEFFVQRLSLRYLRPISLLQSEGTFQGEGFSIVTIQCALIEFLAATTIGKNYRYSQAGQKPGEHEYSGSRALFAKFLTDNEPFNKWFGTADQAQEFYADVRCALLHEARTKNGWRIWASGDRAVDFDKKIVRRNALQKGIEEYIQGYGDLLPKNHEAQSAFIRKFDHLATG